MNEKDALVVLAKEIEREAREMLFNSPSKIPYEEAYQFILACFDKAYKNISNGHIVATYITTKEDLKKITHKGNMWELPNKRTFSSLRTAKCWVKSNVGTLDVNCQIQLAGEINQVGIEGGFKL